MDLDYLKEMKEAIEFTEQYRKQPLCDCKECKGLHTGTPWNAHMKKFPTLVVPYEGESDDDEICFFCGYHVTFSPNNYKVKRKNTDDVKWDRKKKMYYFGRGV